ncbi:MAG TPA: lytic transglycosylase [Clostridiales bacterium]|nr:lytic transglycosylase [Clostridiales bacterium]
MSTEYGVKSSVVFAVAEVESHFNPKAKSKVGAIGIMQLMPKTASWIAQNLSIEEFKEEDLYDAQTNIRFGVWYLSYLYIVFEEDWQVFAAYNAGEGAVKDWIEDKNFKKEDIPYSETAFYVKKVERAVKRYAKKNFAAFD